MLTKFLHDLYDNGRIVLDAAPAEIDGLDQVQGTLIEIDRDARTEFPGDCPELDAASALWAAQFLFKACHLLANRDLPAEAILSELDPAKTPVERSPSALYSVDLSFRFLPDLERLACQAAPHDPLVEALHAQGIHWPLSSVGMDLGNATFELDPILTHPALSTRYIERVIARKDKSRLGDPATAALVREAIGAHPELCPEIAAAVTGSN